MALQRYSVNHYPIQAILTWIESSEIAVPEIQRPFVWNATKVRDLLDSLYEGYPIGYLIAWKNPAIRLKDGTNSEGKRILIDGQQRVAALMTSLLAQPIIDKDYKRGRIKISFNPQQKKFEVYNPAIGKDRAWIPDISTVLSKNIKMLKLVNTYHENNPQSDKDEIFESIELLKNIVNNHIGLIELNPDLDIETVTEIFIRINSKGQVLSQADFAMSKIASNEIYDGHLLRKCIDYFCHLAVAPEFYPQLIEMDNEFSNTEYFKKMTWLKDEKDDLYDPSYTDMLRVAFISEFKRGRLEALVALLSGRDFETREYKAEIAEKSFGMLEDGILKFMNETNFKRFVMILRSAGFIDTSMIRSQNTVNFAYVVYLVLRAQKKKSSKIESLVRKWFVMSILTGRYSGSPETAFEKDIRRIEKFGVERHLKDIEDAEMSSAFWNAGLPQQMNTSVASSPYFNTYLAASVKMNDKGFLSKEICVKDLITHKGDVHHIFPREYLKSHGLKRGQYNQIANYVLMQSEINIAIGNKPPSIYFKELYKQCDQDTPKYGGIIESNQLKKNFKMHCIPDGIEEMDIKDYDNFLNARRKLMAHKIKKYYQKL